MATIVDVTILGNRYKLKSSDNEAGQLEELAARLDARMQETASHLKRVNPLNVSILTALQLAEELAKSHGEARAAYAKLQKQYNDELARLGRQHAAELAQCKKDAAELEKKCPITGQPDFAEIRISYIPDVKMVESKSLKLYLFSFRNHGDFHEDCVNTIMKDLIRLMEPKYIEVTGLFTPRGGISIYPFANYGRPGTKYARLAEQRFAAHE